MFCLMNLFPHLQLMFNINFIADFYYFIVDFYAVIEEFLMMVGLSYVGNSLIR